MKDLIIFDYDGVIAESVNVKTETFAKMYKPYGNEIVVKVMKHHEANGGMSRFEKFKIYHKDFLEQEINSLKVAELAKQFSDIVLQKVADSPYVEGAYNFISSNYQKYNFYISTGTPTDEIEIILEKNDIRKYFKNFHVLLFYNVKWLKTMIGEIIRMYKRLIFRQKSIGD